MSNRLPPKYRLKDHPSFADTSLRCKRCDGLYEEDDPPIVGLKGYCSEECKQEDEKHEAKKEALYRLYQEKLREEWKLREQSRRVDAEYVARRMPYDDGPKKGWWSR